MGFPGIHRALGLSSWFETSGLESFGESVRSVSTLQMRKPNVHDTRRFATEGTDEFRAAFRTSIANLRIPTVPAGHKAPSGLVSNFLSWPSSSAMLRFVHAGLARSDMLGFVTEGTDEP